MLSRAERQALIDKIAQFPDKVEAAAEGLNPEQLNTPYGAGKWTVEQVVHHLADAHLVAFARIKVVLTEEHPAMMDYQQDLWADLPDVKGIPLSSSLTLLRSLHSRWRALLSGIPDSAWERWGIHAKRGRLTVEDLLVLYAGHGERHLKSILDLRASRGW